MSVTTMLLSRLDAAIAREESWSYMDGHTLLLSTARFFQGDVWRKARRHLMPRGQSCGRLATLLQLLH